MNEDKLYATYTRYTTANDMDFRIVAEYYNATRQTTLDAQEGGYYLTNNCETFQYVEIVVYNETTGETEPYVKCSTDDAPDLIEKLVNRLNDGQI